MSNVFDKSWEPAVIVALSLSVTVTLSVSMTASLSVRDSDLWPHFMMPTDRSYGLTL